jgi:hypothetical protein
VGVYNHVLALPSGVARIAIQSDSATRRNSRFRRRFAVSNGPQDHDIIYRLAVDADGDKHWSVCEKMGHEIRELEGAANEESALARGRAPAHDRGGDLWRELSPYTFHLIQD